MAFQLIRWEPLDRESVDAVVEHCGNRFRVNVVATEEQARELSDQFTAEMSYEEAARVEWGLAKDDEASGVFAVKDEGLFLVDGTVSNVIPLEDDESLVDLYLMNGPEFLAVTSRDLTEVPPLDTRMRLWVRGLRIYPVFS